MTPEGTKVMNMYLKIKYIEKKLLEMQGKMNNSPSKRGNFNKFLLGIDQPIRQNISKKIDALNKKNKGLI